LVLTKNNISRTKKAYCQKERGGGVRRRWCHKTYGGYPKKKREMSGTLSTRFLGIDRVISDLGGVGKIFRKRHEELIRRVKKNSKGGNSNSGCREKGTWGSSGEKKEEQLKGGELSEGGFFALQIETVGKRGGTP